MTEVTDTVRDERKTITKTLVDSLLLFIGSGNHTLKDMSHLLKISISTITKLYKRYLSGEFQDISQFKSLLTKKSTRKNSIMKKYYSNGNKFKPCISLIILSYKLLQSNNASNYYPSTKCRIIKKMNYTRKSPTLVPINRNTSQKKSL
ncbi:hypothetical protein DMUE_0504 [Dictyocoela muelleri]|nr:hypothetical protein DMUE_0504 [Dictyocoela muelleri]